MAQIEVAVEIDRPADEVWKIIGPFNGLSDWFPGIDACEQEGDVRTLTTANGSIKERLKENDDAERRQVYSIEEAPFPLESHTTTMSVREEGTGSVIVFQVDIAPDTMAPIMEAIYNAAANAAKEKAEA